MNSTVIIVHPDLDISRALTAQISALSSELVVLESDSWTGMELLVDT